MGVVQKVQYGITLSGGGARGLAHVGVLAALEDYGIEPGVISGASMGAVVGVLYAAGCKPQEILHLVRSQRMMRAMRLSKPRYGLLTMDFLKEILQEYIPVNDFAALKKPFFVSVTNLNKGVGEIHHEGVLIDYVLASASIPVVFKPVIIDGCSYVDGGLMNNLPVEPVSMRSHVNIGVHVNHIETLEKIQGLRDVGERCFRLAIYQTVRERMKQCGVLIDPPETRRFGTYEFDKAQELYDIGYKAAEAKIMEITEGLNLNKILSNRFLYMNK